MSSNTKSIVGAICGALLVFKLLVVGLIAPATAAAPGLQPQHIAKVPATPVVQKLAKSLEQRKTQIAQHLADKYNKPYNSVKAIVDLAWKEAAKQPHISPELVLAVIQKESSLNAKAASRYGANGYMQVVKRFHKEKLNKHESLIDPAVNIRVGTQILQEYALKQNGNLHAALVKYSGNAKGYAEFVLKEASSLKRIA